MSWIRPATRLAAVASGLAVLAATTLSPASGATAPDAQVSPLNNSIVVTGAGWGHGIGMSQWGAYGAASSGLSYAKILAFYYPGTTLSALATGTRIRVWISGDNDNRLHFSPASGLKIYDSSGKSWRVPTGSSYKQWRISRSGSYRVLHYKNASGSWVKRTTTLSRSRVWTVKNNTSGWVSVRMPDGTARDLREKVSLRFKGTGAVTVNSVTLENYLKSVVPSEMPASWPAEALKAQAVAARSYAARYLTTPLNASYDICDTTYCQVYKGAAIRSGSTRTPVEAAESNAAAAATSGKVLKSGGSVALTMFSASNGGWSAQGDYSYLVVKQDPYDGKMRNQAWSAPISSAKVQAAWPSIGTFTGVQVTSRDGQGPWGGRAVNVKVTGNKGSVTVTGGAFKKALGLRERLFLIVGGLAPGTANYERWQDLGGTTSWVGAPTSSEVAVAGGLAARFAQADFYASAATGSKYLTGAVAKAFAAEGGPAGTLGFPKTDVQDANGGTYADFTQGRITCPKTGDCLVSFG